MKIVYSYYVLDIIHEGHILQMKNAKALAGMNGKSVVGILTDEAVMEKKSKPVMSFDDRMRLAEAIKYVDVVVPQDTYSPITNCRRIKPDILLESSSHSNKDINKIEKIMKTLGGRVIVTPYYPTQSSTLIKERVKNA